MYCFVLTFDFLGVVRGEVIVRYFNEHFDSIFPKINSGADTSSYNWHTTPYGYDILKKQRAWKNISHQKANQNRFRALSDLFFYPLLHNAILSQKCGLSVVTQKWMANWHHFYNFKTKKKVCPSDMSDILGQTHVSYVWHGWTKMSTIWSIFSFPITVIKRCGFWKRWNNFVVSKEVLTVAFRVTVVTIEKVS